MRNRFCRFTEWTRPSDTGATNMVLLTEDRSHAVAVLMNTDETLTNDEFRMALTEDLIAGAKLAA